MEVPCDMLLHPELLTNEQLRHVIVQRQLKVPNVESMPRDRLLELFHSFCVPFGQRMYRDSGRGKLLNRVRHLSPETKPTLNTVPEQSRKVPRACIEDRIKPPPDLLTGHLKRIKLDTNQTDAVKNGVNNFKRKMSIDGTSSVSNSPPLKKERKPITWP